MIYCKGTIFFITLQSINHHVFRFMLSKLYYKLHSGKNNKLIYLVKNYLSLLIPNSIFRAKLKPALKSIDTRADKGYILKRVDYYCKLTPGSIVPNNSPCIGKHDKRWHKVYWFDSREYTRWFTPSLHWVFRPGDINFIPESPSIVKSRPISEDDANANGVILKLNKVRHFIFVNDPVPFREKKDIAIFRGKVKDKPQRVAFFEKYFSNPMCNLGDISRYPEHNEWHVEKMTIADHLKYKFILALEGNDVASNLKWVMSSNSVAVMPRPTCETWFMEGTLIPNYHYIEIKPDFSDLEERLNHYIQHPNEAESIIKHAHEYVNQFKDKKREDIISLLVLDKYFRMTGQK